MTTTKSGRQSAGQHGGTTPAATRTVLVSGATGMVGTALARRLAGRGDRVLTLVRDRARVGSDALLWEPVSGNAELGDPGPIDAVVHLAGENVAAGRWTHAKKARIRDSRVDGTRLLVDALAQLESPPRLFVCASAVGIYGDRGEQMLDEASEPGAGFLAGVCKEWETAAQRATGFAERVVNLRFGVILSARGGALAKMLTPFKLGLGGVIGSGRQYMSWVALSDAVGAIEHVLGHDELSGPVNVVAPQPVTNREFTQALGAALHRPTPFPMPAFAAKLAFGEMAEEMLLAGARVLPTRLTESGFRCEHAALSEALKSLVTER